MDVETNRPRRHRTALIGLMLAALASTIAQRICDSMLPAIAHSFDVGVGDASRTITWAALAYGVCQLAFGPLGDRYGKYRLVALASLASLVGALVCYWSPTLTMLCWGRALTGATTAAIIPLSMAWIGDEVSIEERQAALANLMSGVIFGLIGAQTLGGFLADTLGWRFAFAALAVLFGLSGFHLYRNAASSPMATPSQVDVLPLKTVRALLSRSEVRLILGTVVLESMAAMGVLAFIPYTLNSRFNLSLAEAGLVMATYGAGGMCYTVTAQRWVDALGPSMLARLGGSLQGMACLALALGPTWLWAIPACFASGLGFYLFHTTLQTRATQMAPETRGTAVSVFASCFFFAQAAGVALCAWAVGQFGPQTIFIAAAAVLPTLGWYFSGHPAEPIPS